MGDPLSVVLITADDMNWDAVGVFGCPVPGTTPNIDQLAADGVRFDHAHVTIAVCQPSRSALMTGRYPHNSGGEGFFRLRREGVPILPELLRGAGYAVGILGKVGHSTPYESFEWDMTYDMDDLGKGRSPSTYADHARTFIEGAKSSGKPFFLMANSHDPHRPFHGNDPQDWYDREGVCAAQPSRVFKQDEANAPGHLADLPEIRLEMAEYYSSVRRCDDTVGALLQVLLETGAESNTLVMFLSDNGMAFPFAKTNCYLHSTRTPWIARWPGVVAPGSVDAEHFVSGIDYMPTILEAAGIEPPADTDGSSFLPVLRGETQRGRDVVFTEFHQTAGKRVYPMRCIQNKQYGYIFNPWSDGERIFKNESQSGRTFKAMQEAAETDERIAARCELFLKRVGEELYDFENDPDALVNLVNDPKHADVLDSLRSQLAEWMQRTNDPALEAFGRRESRKDLDEFVAQVEDELPKPRK